MTRHNDAPTVAAPLTTITPAEVGGLWVPANPEHAKLGWTYDFDQTERISNAAYERTGYGATMEVVEFVMAEADRRHATALAAKDAELAEAWQRYVDANEARIDAEAQLAEARKALEPFAAVAEHDIGDDETDDDIFWPISNARYSMSGRLRVGHLRAASRALTGGKNG